MERLRCEHLADPLGIDTPSPRLSWRVVSSRNGTTQAGYQVLAATARELLVDGAADVWDSGWVASSECVLVPWGGPTLASRQRVHWTVRVRDDAGEVSAYAPGAWWEMGLCDAADWQAEWIAGPDAQEDSAVTYFRNTVEVDGPVERARAYATALGVYEISVNGVRLGDARLTPGWTDYHQRVQYQVFDLTDVLRAGDNTVEAALAEGWYSGFVGFVGGREHYGDTPQLLVQIEADTAAGRTVFGSGEGWLAGDGPVRTSDMLLGETQHLGRAAESWRAVRVTPGSPGARVMSPGPPVRVLTELTPRDIRRTAPDLHLIDLGQNMVGVVRLQLRGAAGTEITVRHAEMLDADGALYVENLRSAASVDRYVLAGDGVETCEPVFTFHGFRYAEVSGWDGPLSPGDVTGVVLGSDIEPAGAFACSDERVNQLHANIVWGARGNFLEVPTDCPQRDERLGWTGDAQVFAETACYVFDTAAFYAKWQRDLIDAQSPDGGFPDVAPRIVDPADGAAGWADAGTIVPWVVARRFGDDRLLAEAYPAMRRWVDYVHRANPGLLWIERRNNDMGDWLNVGVDTDKDLIATAFFAHSTRLTAKAAAALGHAGEAEELHALADAIVDAFRVAFVLDDGRLKNETQTAYGLALRFGLIPEHAVGAAVDRLVEDIDDRGHLTTGFLGVNHLLPALSIGGRHDVAYRLLLHDDYPSWLYSVKHGATTIWERWDGWTAEAGFQDPAMNSFNHYAFGAVGEWLYRTAAGIGFDETAAAGRVLEIAPQPTADLDWVEATHDSPLGRVGCAWRRDEAGDLAMTVDVPVGAVARVRVPGAEAAIDVGSGHHTFTAEREARS